MHDHDHLNYSTIEARAGRPVTRPASNSNKPYRPSHNRHLCATFWPRRAGRGPGPGRPGEAHHHNHAPAPGGDLGAGRAARSDIFIAAIGWIRPHSLQPRGAAANRMMIIRLAASAAAPPAARRQR